MNTSQFVIFLIALLFAASTQVPSTANRLRRTSTTCPPVPTNCPCGVIIPSGSNCKRCKINCPTTTTQRPTCPPVPTNCPCGIIIPAGATCKRCKLNCPPTTTCTPCPCGVFSTRLRRTGCPVCKSCTTTSPTPAPTPAPPLCSASGVPCNLTNPAACCSQVCVNSHPPGNATCL
jgi:hypothetical protein